MSALAEATTGGPGRQDALDHPVLSIPRAQLSIPEVTYSNVVSIRCSVIIIEKGSLLKFPVHSYFLFRSPCCQNEFLYSVSFKTIFPCMRT